MGGAEISEALKREMHALGFKPDEFKFFEIRHKAGISVYRCKRAGESFIIKHFSAEEQRREIKNYKVLTELNVPTVKVVAVSEAAIMLEDIEASSKERLAREEDLRNPQAAKAIARWYRKLHDAGGSIGGLNELYKETDMFSLENLKIVETRSGTQGNEFWQKLKNNFELIRTAIDSFKWTLTYNDFAAENLIVARDLSSAKLLDYNLLGCGFRYMDISNVTVALGEEARKAFLFEYGDYSKAEKAVNEIIAPMVGLIVAYRKNVFPDWAVVPLTMLQAGELDKRLDESLRLLNSIE